MTLLIILLAGYCTYKVLRFAFAQKPQPQPTEVEPQTVKAFEDFQQRFEQPVTPQYQGDVIWVLINTEWFYFAQGELEPGLYNNRGKKIGIYWDHIWEFKEKFSDGIERIRLV